MSELFDEVDEDVRRDQLKKLWEKYSVVIIAGAILIESALSYLGFGPPPPNPSWGDLLSQGRANMQMWWLILFPGLAIFLTVLAYNLIGEGLQEATDPRLKQSAH